MRIETNNNDNDEALPSLAQRLFGVILLPILQTFHKANNSSTIAPFETAPPEMNYFEK